LVSSDAFQFQIAGDENWHIYAANLETDEIKDLTPLPKVSARMSGVSDKFPEEVLIGINDRGEGQLHDVYRVNIVTGERELVQLNPGFAGFVTDDDYRVRFAVTFTPQAGQLYLMPNPTATDPKQKLVWEKWVKFTEFSASDAMTSSLSGFDKTGTKVYLLDSRERNTGALKLLDLKTNKAELIAEHDKADISGAISHPTKKHVQAVSFTYARREWKILDDSIKPDLDYLATVADGEIQLTSRTLDDKTWTVAYVMDDGPVQFYLYDRENSRKEGGLSEP